MSPTSVQGLVVHVKVQVEASCVEKIYWYKVYWILQRSKLLVLQLLKIPYCSYKNDNTVFTLY
jgi:hypothetical protein